MYPNLCEHGGACTDGVDSYTCTCVTGYEGDNCETGKLLKHMIYVSKEITADISTLCCTW